uniref:Bm5175 n=1 Tax=Brugia malayi TaxID=6279 RepID=A0A1I9GB71_BRUMA|nr:Bm5175 [Brugia malayi]
MDSKMDQLMNYIDELDITEVIDASAKLPPSGILRGHVNIFGQYEECMLARQQLPNSTRTITGSYVRIFVDKKLRNYNAKGACKLNQYNIGDPSFDVCLPSSCDNYDTLMTLSRSLIKFNGSTPVCTVKQASVRLRPIDYKTWIVLAIIAFIGVIAILATAWDLFTNYFNSDYYKLASIETTCWFHCLMAFSVIRNTKDIFNIESTNKPGQIGPIHFMRFISMAWVIFGHATSGYMMLSSNILDCKETFKNLWTQFMTNAFFSVDTFFFMSGLLVSYTWFKEYRKDKKKAMSSTTWLIFYIHRIVRLSPPYYIVIAFYSFVFKSFLVNMPVILMTLNDYCEESWWTNFLYLNNFIYYNRQCYLVTWYLATDFQIHIFAPALLIPLALKPMLGFIIAGLLLLLSTVANLVTVYMEYFPPTDFYIGVMDPRMGPYRRYSLLIYQAPWIRCQVYIIGPINDFMSLSVWKPLGRLTYCTYLTHLIVLIYMLCIGVNAFSFSSITHTFIVFALPCCIISWFFAYWLSILFELPISKLEMILLGRIHDKTVQRQTIREIQAVEQNHPIISCWKKSEEL